MSRKIQRQKARRRKNLKRILHFGIIPATVGALILPLALATPLASGQTEEAASAYSVALADAQSFVVSSTAVGPMLERESYSATTSEEIATKHAEEAAAAAAEEAAKKAAEEQRAKSSKNRSFTPQLASYSMVSPGSGAVRWPLPADSWSLGSRLGDGRNHQGIDFIASQGTPIYAAAAGTVVVAQDNYSAYGTTVEIVHNINGQQIKSLYAHMPVGANAVHQGDTVEAGQLIGYVGNTGRSFGAHLHLEVRLNGAVIDGYEWLTANAG